LIKINAACSRSGTLSEKQEQAMPTIDILILALVVIAFFSFAVLLAWGDRQTQAIAKASRQRALAGAHIEALKRAAEAVTSESKAAAKDKTPMPV
jgi:hypothetical protein